MPDRLPSLVVLVCFWIPPAIAGWLAAGYLPSLTVRGRTRLTYAALPVFVLAYAAAWFFFNLDRMPPYIPGAFPDPVSPPPPRAVANLAVFTCVLVLPGSALACLLAFRHRGQANATTSSPPP